MAVRQAFSPKFWISGYSGAANKIMHSQLKEGNVSSQ